MRHHHPVVSLVLPLHHLIDYIRLGRHQISTGRFITLCNFVSVVLSLDAHIGALLSDDVVPVVGVHQSVIGIRKNLLGLLLYPFE